MKQLSMMAVISCLLFIGCSKSEHDDSTHTATRSASFKIGPTSYSVATPYLGIFNDNGTIHNTLTLTAADGSEVELKFEGSTPSAYALQGFSDALFTTAAGKQYNSISGSLVTTAYTINGALYKATGTFQFKAEAITAPNDTIEITSGIFTNASNEL